jgi:hypothetical protein
MSTAPVFIELPSLTYDSKDHERTGKEPDECELIEVVRKLDASRIESYREAIPTSDFREDNKIWTQIVTHSGDTFIINMPLSEFEKLLTQTHT